MFPPQGRRRPPDSRKWSKGHGRLECREVWVVDSARMEAYLKTVHHWPGARLSGYVRRRRRRSWQKEWESDETHIWVSSLPYSSEAADHIAEHLRGHWLIENSVFYVRDASYREDQNHGRKIAPALSVLRNLAINIIRRQGHQYIRDGWREIAALRDDGLCLLHALS
jgi:predicted transposase YbfD/YdcC